MTDHPPNHRLPPEGLDACGLIDQYARWKRKAALLIWVALGLLLLGLALQAILSPAA